jgi:hypothetical protein
MHHTLDGVRAGGGANNVFTAWLPRCVLLGFRQFTSKPFLSALFSKKSAR